VRGGKELASTKYMAFHLMDCANAAQTRMTYLHSILSKKFNLAEMVPVSTKSPVSR